jgi:hypothetical protein
MNTAVRTRYGEVRGSVEHLAATWFHKLDGRRGLDRGVRGRLWPRLGA